MNNSSRKNLRCCERCVHGLTNSSAGSGHGHVCSVKNTLARLIQLESCGVPLSAVIVPENYRHRQLQLTKLALVMQPAALGSRSGA